MTMKITLTYTVEDIRGELVELLKHHEGVRDEPYDDKTGKKLEYKECRGNPTIGVGNLVPLSPKVINAMLLAAIDDAHNVAIGLPFHFDGLPASARIAVLDMCYNMGNRIRSFEKAMAAINRGDFDAAADEILDSAWARGPHKSRAETVAKLMRKAATE